MWGTVCDDYWDEKDASVVCRMLGYSPYGTVYCGCVLFSFIILGAIAISNAYTEGNWYMHFKDLNCSGHEENIFDCPFDKFIDSSCSNYEDASVICQCKMIKLCLNIILLVYEVNTVAYSDCNTGAVKLTGGPNEREGKVEVCINGVWGSVCDNGWDLHEAHVVCKQLGFGGISKCLITTVSVVYLSF